MTSTNRLIIAAAGAALLLALAGCAAPAEPAPTASASAEQSTSPIITGACDGDTGVTVVVDSSALEGGSLEEWCVTTDETIEASQALAVAAVTTEGTTEYGDQVVCRVNGLPSPEEPVGSAEDPAYVEACESMPAAFAYWSLWVKPSGGEWGYAQEGLSTLQLEPGDALELQFMLDGAPAEPSA